MKLRKFESGMDKKEYFRLGDKKLYESLLLVEFNISPIFFIVRDEDECPYLVLGREDDIFLISKTTDHNLEKMLEGISSMRYTFLDSDEFWIVETKDSIENDIVKFINKEDIDEKYLPKAGYTYTIPNKEVKDGLEYIKSRCRRD